MPEQGARSGPGAGIPDPEALLNTLAGPPERIDLGLERMQAAMAMGQIPQRLPFPVITVAGTNGKGSTVAYLEALYVQAGYRCAAYTSPHIWHFRERLRVDGQALGEADWCAHLEALAPVAQQIPLTYFELSTLAALRYLIHQPPQVAILEVGLGGRLDAVNAVAPDLSVITGVDLDHQALLGATREEIGREKAGILRPGVPALYGDSAQPCASVLRQADALGTPLWHLGRDILLEDRQCSFDGQSWPLPPAPWGGPEQDQNLALALAACYRLQARLPAAFPVPETWAIPPRLLGRCQHLRPWGRGGPELVVDCAHNPQATRALAQDLERNPARRTHGVWGMLVDKDIAASLEPFRGRVDRWYPVVLSGIRGAPEPLLYQALMALDAIIAPGDAEQTLLERVEAAAQGLGAPDRVLVFGSFQVLAALPEAWFMDQGIDSACTG